MYRDDDSTANMRAIYIHEGKLTCKDEDGLDDCLSLWQMGESERGGSDGEERDEAEKGKRGAFGGNGNEGEQKERRGEEEG